MVTIDDLKKQPGRWFKVGACVARVCATSPCWEILNPETLFALGGRISGGPLYWFEVWLSSDGKWKEGVPRNCDGYHLPADRRPAVEALVAQAVDLTQPKGKKDENQEERGGGGERPADDHAGEGKRHRRKRAAKGG